MSTKKTKRTYGNPSTLSYWMVKKGLSQEEAEIQKTAYIAEMKRKKIEEHGSEEAYHAYRSKNCSLRKENAIKRFGGDEQAYMLWKQEVGKKGLKPYMLDYWTSKGFSEQEARENIRKQGIANSVRCIEFWMKQGMTEEEAVNKVSDIQNITSIESFKHRYGTEEGIRRYEVYVNKITDSTIFKDSDFQIEMGKRNRYSKTLDYWISKGYSIDEAEDKRQEAIKETSQRFPEHFQRLGHDRATAEAMSSEYQRTASLSRKFSPTSKIEDEVFEWVVNNMYPDATKGRIYDDKQRRLFFPDIVTSEFIIEVYGDYWHANPKMYDDATIMWGNKTARQIRIDDKKRITRISNLTGLPVFLLWEKDIIELGISESIKNCIGEYYESN